jgi:hypothetical protein
MKKIGLHSDPDAASSFFSGAFYPGELLHPGSGSAYSYQSSLAGKKEEERFCRSSEG